MLNYEHVLITEMSTVSARQMALEEQLKIVAVETTERSAFLCYFLRKGGGTVRLLVCVTPQSPEHPRGKWLVVDVPLHQIVRIKDRGVRTP